MPVYVLFILCYMMIANAFYYNRKLRIARKPDIVMSWVMKLMETTFQTHASYTCFGSRNSTEASSTASDAW
jgi:hypothetical protein